MGKASSPRHGSMQFWPRVRARRPYPRIRSWPSLPDHQGLLGFIGYKVGMTHVFALDNNPNSLSKGEEIFIPVSVVEVPPLKILSVRFYKKTPYGLKVLKDVVVNTNKYLQRKIRGLKKAQDINAVDKVEGYDDISVIVFTMPHLSGLGKKKPEVLEIKLGGSLDSKLAWVKENYAKDLRINSFFQEGELIDVHAVTKGKGTEGARLRFGLRLRQHKSEKSRRNPGSLGPWNAQTKIMWRVAKAGQRGYHLRTQFNNLLLKIIDNPDEINVKGGYLHYGKVKSQAVLIKGSIPGPAKRTVVLTKAIRPYPKPTKYEVRYISLESKQGV